MIFPGELLYSHGSVLLYNVQIIKIAKISQQDYKNCQKSSQLRVKCTLFVILYGSYRRFCELELFSCELAFFRVSDSVGEVDDVACSENNTLECFQ
jgi:hypothetical protein